MSRITDDVPEEPDDLLEQCLLMNKVFPQIENPASRSRVIASVREVLRDQDSGDG